MYAFIPKNNYEFKKAKSINIGVANDELSIKIAKMFCSIDNK